MCYFTVQAWMCLASMELWCLWADGDFGGRLGTNDLVVPCLHVVSVVTLGRKQTTWGPWLWSQASGETLGYKRCMGVLDIPHVCGLRFCWQVSHIRSIPVDQYHWRSTATCSSLWLYGGEAMFCSHFVHSSSSRRYTYFVPSQYNRIGWACVLDWCLPLFRLPVQISGCKTNKQFLKQCDFSGLLQSDV